MCVLIQMYRLSHVTCVSLPLTADSVSFPDDLDYSFQHGLLNTNLVQSLDNNTSITLPPSQRPHLSSTVTVPADTSSRVPDKDDLLHCSPLLKTTEVPLSHTHTHIQYTHARSHTHSLTHSLTHPLTHSLTHSLAHSLTHSLTHTLTHSLSLNSLVHSLCCRLYDPPGNPQCSV